MGRRAALAFWVLFIAAIPFQTRFVIGGWRGEWESFSLYGTDIALALLLVVTPGWFRAVRSFPGKWLLLGAVGLAAASLFSAADTGVALFRFSLFFKGVLASAVAAVWFRAHGRASFLAIAAMAVVQAVVVIAQFVGQSDVGLGVLGETALDPAAAGVATVVQGGLEYLRGYGTTPHPNVAGMMLVAGVAALAVLVPSRWRTAKGVMWGIGAVVVTTALLQTFSRLALAGLAIVVAGVIAGTLVGAFHRCLLSAALIVLGVAAVAGLVLWPLWSRRFTVSAGDQSVDLRRFYEQRAWETIREHPLLGVGMGNGVIALRGHVHAREEWLIQPVHSIYVLLASEAGIPALVLIMAFLASVLRQAAATAPFGAWLAATPCGARQALRSAAVVRRREEIGALMLVAAAVLFVGAFDHWPMTLQQGVLLWWVVLGGIIGLSDIDRQPSGEVI